MGGRYEIRLTGPGREQFRLFCLLESGTGEEMARRGLPRSAIVAMTGMLTPWRTVFAERDYQRVRELGTEHQRKYSPHCDLTRRVTTPRAVRWSKSAGEKRFCAFTGVTTAVSLRRLPGAGWPHSGRPAAAPAGAAAPLDVEIVKFGYPGDR